MKFVAVDLYQSFQCMAGDCPDTCCAGWRIVVDWQAYERFQELAPQSLREDVLSHLRQEGELLFFENDGAGRCAMLNLDGLCRLQLGASEKMLCNTCRKYPRLVNVFRHTLYVSMAASCPVVSERLLHQGMSLVQGEKGMAAGSVSLERLSLTQQVCVAARRGFRQACGLVDGDEEASLPADIPLLAKSFLRLAGEVARIGSCYREGQQVLELTAGLEKWQQEDVLEGLAVFCGGQKETWARLRDNFFPYRIFSRRLEYPEEGTEECLCQVQGELFMIRLFGFCCYLRGKNDGNMEDRDWQYCIQRAYRFCANGKSCAGRVHQSFQEFFVQKLLWWFVLF